MGEADVTLAIDRRLALAGGLAAALPLGACTGPILIDARSGGPAKLAEAVRSQAAAVSIPSPS